MQLPKFKGSKISCSYSAGDNVIQSFHAELKQRISEYFESRQLKSTGNWKLYSKAVILLCAYVAVYSHLVFFTPPIIFAILECLVLGGLTAAVGFNIMHDGIHGSFSSRVWVNKLAGLTLNMLGANNFMWKTKHNIIHHTYTNIDGVDDDIEARPLLRYVTRKPFTKFININIGIFGRLIHCFIYGGYFLLIIRNTLPSELVTFHSNQ